MCITSIAFAKLEGTAEGVIGTFPLTHVAVCNDHPHHAELEWCINIDAVNEQMGPSARVALELTLEAARSLANALTNVVRESEEVVAQVSAADSAKRSVSRPLTRSAGSALEGSAKGVIGWFPVTSFVARNGHPLQREMEWCINIEAVNEELGPGARMGLQLTLESTKALAEAIMKVVRETDEEEAQYAADEAAKLRPARPPER